MSKYRVLFEHQEELYGLITRAVSNLMKVGKQKINTSRVESRLECLKCNWHKFQENHLAIRTLYGNENDELRTELKSHFYFKDNWYSLCEEAFLDAQEEMGKLIEDFQATKSVADGATLANQSAITSQHTDRPTTGRLPRLDLPKFNGDYNEWAAYKDLFQSLVGHNTSLTCVEKLHYLKLSLTSSAATRLKNIGVTSENFQRAWDSLVSHYENERILVHTYLNVLFTTKIVTRGLANEIERLLNDTQQALDALEALHRPVSEWSDLLVYITINKLDPTTIMEWEKEIGASTKPPTFKELETFLIRRVRALQAFERTTKTPQSSNSQRRQESGSKSHHISQSYLSKKCSSCNSTEHYISACPVYSAKTTTQRKELIQQKRLCFNCLGPHMLRQCKSRKRCLTCGGQHHTSIHQELSSSSPSISASASQSPTSTVNIDSNPPSAVNIVTNCSLSPNTSASRNESVVLATALVQVVSNTGELMPARALIDQGSEVSLVTEDLAQRLRLPRSRASIPIVGMGSDKSRATNGQILMTIKSNVTPSFSCEIETLVLPRLTGHLPSIKASMQDWTHLRGLTLADPGFAKPGKIDIVFGVKVYKRIIQEGLRIGPDTSPIAQKTRLGWILSGDTLVNDHESAVGHSYQCSPDRELIEILERFWLQEEAFPSERGELSYDEMECENHFISTHTRDATGRYIVRLPFKKSTDELRDSKTGAHRMLSRMEAKFLREPKVEAEYKKCLKEYLDLGHMRLGPAEPRDPRRVFYLPHHGVVKESSATTKLRVVFNGSHTTHDGLSLNDCLHTGPKILEDLADIITRWRHYPYVFSADIEKMFRQVRIHSDDWDLQRILWRQSLDIPISSYQLCTVTYGLACAPYLAIRTIRQLTIDEGHRFPQAVEALLKETYVDNVHSGAYSIEEGLEKIRQIDNLLLAGGLPLQQWVSNDNELLSGISESRRAEVSSLSFEEEPVFRALGLSWQLRSDSFTFTSQVKKDIKVWTKRSVLSRIAQCFDPLGWLSPVIINAKIFMQDLWVTGLEWDEPLPKTLITRWLKFLKELSYVSAFSIPRWIGLSPSVVATELHGFSDASQNAISAVVYLRVTNDIGEIQISIISAKTKVTPRKNISTQKRRVGASRVTIPRLELSAAVLLTKHVSRVRQVLNRNEIVTHLWTDSTVTLYWIKGPPHQWKDFVRNRVATVQEILPAARWHHVPGEDNPADCASRGISPQHLTPDHIWWYGPAWLKKHSRFWPSTIPHLDPNTNLEKRTKVVATVQRSVLPVWSLIDRYSNLTRLLRITATCKRAISRMKSNNATSSSQPLTPLEIETSRLFWIKVTQRAYFSPEIKQLKDCGIMPKSSPLQKLVPFLDNNGILRLGGRLRNSLLDPDTKHPAILPRESPLTILIIKNAHLSTLHGGTQVTLATLRRSYWILGGRAPIRSFILRCVKCARQRAVMAQQLMGQLPPSRTTPSRPFTHCGVDYAGPIILKTHQGRGRKTYKGYIVLFVCFTTSAVHLELATDYSTNGFLAAFRRFTGRRGICTTITSDRGTNLVGADSELRKLFDESAKELGHLINLLANDGTEWKFNPAGAPHFGGKWEANVKSVKFHLKRVIGDAILTYEEYSTLLIQIEAVLNSRPICPLSDDPTDVDSLTPGHFLIGAALNTLPEPSLLDIKTSRLSRWQLQRQLLERFWQRWSSEYLQRLQGISKWHTRSENIKVVALVLLTDERYPPSKWPLARVIDVNPGADGLVRVVTVKTQTSTFTRPIVKLCPLPITWSAESTTPTTKY